ncbi:hypothetical protein EBU71_13475 [bacterium]|nr:hypothetical protein [Candidatus Elulimicrobium humile]
MRRRSSLDRKLQDLEELKLEDETREWLQREYLNSYNYSDLYIEGPISLTRHDGMGKTIYIFGDRHVDFDYPCPVEYDKAMIIHLKDVLETLCFEHESDGNQLDLFFEISRFDKTEEKFDLNTFNAIHQIPSALLKKYHQKPYSEYIRVHYTDLRRMCSHLDRDKFIRIFQLCFLRRLLFELALPIDDDYKIDDDIHNAVNYFYIDGLMDDLIRFEEFSHLSQDYDQSFGELYSKYHRL